LSHDATNPNPTLTADLFCRVVDNLGDIGVMWRLARQLTTEKKWRVRLWVDRLDGFARIEHTVNSNQPTQICEQVEIRQWSSEWEDVRPNAVVIAGFSCELPAQYLAQLATQPNPVWLQFEYLSAEQWVSSFHGLHSARNDHLKPVFFFPGFTTDTAGLIREQDLLAQRDQWQAHGHARNWLHSIGVNPDNDVRLVSVFIYPHAPLHALIQQMQQTNQRFHLIIPSHQSETTWSDPTVYPDSNGQVTWQHIGFLDQRDYDKLLWSCDLNLVRGEDSLVRAIWAAKPMLWHIYQQPDGAHHPKLDAWLRLTDWPAAVSASMRQWADGELTEDLVPSLSGDLWHNWQKASQTLSNQLASQSDLATRLDDWCRTRCHGQFRA
jgi:uncharacterized repeat protein (TIGR03837 family)